MMKKNECIIPGNCRTRSMYSGSPGSLATISNTVTCKLHEIFYFLTTLKTPLNSFLLNLTRLQKLLRLVYYTNKNSKQITVHKQQLLCITHVTIFSRMGHQLFLKWTWIVFVYASPAALQQHRNGEQLKPHSMDKRFIRSKDALWSTNRVILGWYPLGGQCAQDIEN